MDRLVLITSQEAADAAANSARDAAIAELQGEAQNAVNNAIAAAKAQLGSIQFRYEEITVPYGFGKYWGSERQLAKRFRYPRTPTMTMS